jgi:hypothetical protein
MFGARTRQFGSEFADRELFQTGDAAEAAKEFAGGLLTHTGNFGERCA